ncbi:MAG: G-protein coupled receptor, partial [Alteromonas sp.]|nr:G-protein coupled receptor [Alteromonas sp.]
MCTANKFFVSNIALQLVIAITAVLFAVRFKQNKAAELRKDTVIVQITFTLLGLGLSHFMLTIDRIITVTMRSRYSFVISVKQTWMMIGLSWLIPTAIAIVSAGIVTTGKSSNKVSYGLATLTAASGLTISIALMLLNGYLMKKIRAVDSEPCNATRRLRRMTVLSDSDAAKEDDGISEARICIAMAVAYIVLMFPQILFAFGKLLKTRGLLDMWFMQLASTLMLCSGVVDASLYIYTDAALRKEFMAKIRRIRRRITKNDDDDDETHTMSSQELRLRSKENIHMKAKEKTLPDDILKKDIEI